MFSKSSRYFKLDDVVNLDAAGREILSKSLRLTPPLPAEVYHVVDESDRLDFVASSYYRKSKKWWRICDANLEFLSPRQLLGKETLATTRFPLLATETVTQFPWASLFRAVVDYPGVQEVSRYEQSRLEESHQMVGSMLVSLWSERFERAVDIIYNRENLSADDLAAILSASGFALATPVELRRVGNSIAIPSNSSV